MLTPRQDDDAASSIALFAGPSLCVQVGEDSEEVNAAAMLTVIERSQLADALIPRIFTDGHQPILKQVLCHTVGGAFDVHHIVRARPSELRSM